ncbi:MAG TPA: hypothetical protein ENH87_02085 [Pricia antarctica]|uniref:DNA (Cytosine-5)-methyltransferase 1 n=1 Tax=Pricia antarctica TaxID=641691 RepID=A0A831QM61_9FLAO|nr:hypothetical protein [Pricia antarctica]
MPQLLNGEKTIVSLCSGTGAWERPYVEAGYNVISITLPDNDVLTYKPPKNVYGILAAPPCTMFSLARMNAKTPRDLRAGMETVTACLNIIWECQYKLEKETAHKTTINFWAVENPYNGFLKRFIGRPAFTFQPYDFGDRYKKHTALWGHFNDPIKKSVDLNQGELELARRNSQKLPKFDSMKSKDIHPEFYGKLDQVTRRSITPPGFAKAFFESNR